jgi:hypothetical protein
MSASSEKSQRAINRWVKARIAYSYARNYIQTKSDRCNITEIDLILASNFKGGNGSICEPIESVQKRLSKYSEQLRDIDKVFSNCKLPTLNLRDLEILKDKAQSFIQLTKETSTEIDGFGPSYASALLNIHFPELLPIIDRRVLNGARIKGVEPDSQKQVKNIEMHYKEYINYCYIRLQQSSHSLETLDRELFSMELPECFKRKPKNK